MILLISCGNDKQNKKPKVFNPLNELSISQNIKNEKALELYKKGTEFYKNNYLDSAKNSLNLSLKMEKNPITLNELGIVAYAEEDYHKAIEYYNDAMDLDSLYWPSYINKARSYWLLDNYNEAEKTLLSLKKLSDSEYWQAYANYYLAVTNYNNGGNCEKVYEFLEMSKILSSDSDLSKDYLKFKKHVKKNCG